jgi:RNA polymerase-binding transcription factor DksA
MNKWYAPDNYDAFRRHQAEQDAWLDKRPLCEHCGEPIQDDYLYKIDGALYCEECMKELYRESTEEYEM